MEASLIYFRNKCIGCGICVHQMPEVWEMNALDAKADMLDASFKGNAFFRVLWPDEKLKAKEVAKSCPSKSIMLKNA